MRIGWTGVALVCLLVSSARGESLSPAWPEITLLVAAETGLALDMLQTLDIKRHPGGDLVTVPGGGMKRSTPMYETNPILGSNPSDATVCVYFAGAALLTGAAWYALPPRWRFLAPLAVLVMEVPQIDRNARAGLSIRF